MAKQDEVIRYIYEVTGDQELADAAKALLDLGDVSDETSNAIKGLADEFRKISQAKDAADALGEIAAKQTELADAADNTGLKLKIAAEQQQAATLAYEAASKAVDDAKAAQTAYAATEDKSTEGTKQRVDALREATAAQKQSAQELSAADSTLSSATKGYERVATAQDRLTQSSTDMVDKLRAAGVSTTDLAAAQASLNEKTTETADKVRSIADAAAKLAAEQRELDAETARGAASRDEYNAALERTRASTQQAKEETKGLSEEGANTAGVFERLKGVFAGLLGIFSVGTIVKGLKSIVSAGNDSEQALAQLNAALASTGNAAGLTGDELVKMADKARQSSNLSTEQIVSAQTRLLSYTNILRTEFPDALQVTIDQAQRLGISVEQSAEIVGKALQSPSDAMAALGRQGFKLEEGQKTLLTQLEATGRTAEAQRVIIDLLAESYGGAAAASRIGTFKGLIKGLQDQVGDFFNLVANSGAFEYFKTQLTEAGATIKRLTDDGTLAIWAKNISNAIVGTAEAVKATGVFIVEHIAALTLLAKAYALVKFESFLAGMASIAAGTTQAGNAVTLLSLAITKIPALKVLILGAAGITLLSDELDALAKKFYESSSIGKALKDELASLKAETSANAERFGDAAKALENFSTVQTQTAEQTSRLREDERKEYAASLEGLQQYLALQIKYYEQLKAGNGLNAEGIKYLESLRDRLKEASAGSAALAEGTKLAADAMAAKLTPGAQKLVTELTNITESTVLARERLKSLFASIETKTVDQLIDMALAIERVSEKSEVAGARIRDGLGEELKKLSGEQLLRFQQSATIAFEETGRAADNASLVLQSTLQAALEKLGVTAAESGAKITASGRDMIATFVAVSENAGASGAQIEAAFKKAVASASTKAELEELGRNLEAAANRGTVSAEQTGRAMLYLKDRIRDIDEQLDPLAAKFAEFGLKTQASLVGAAASAKAFADEIIAGAKTGVYAQEDVIRALEKRAAAERAAVVLGTDAQKAAVERNIEAQAAAAGLTTKLTELGVIGQQAGGQISAGMSQAKAAVDAVKTSAQEAEASIIKMSGSGSTTVGDLVYELNKANTSYDSLGEKGKAAFDKVAKAQESGAGGVTGVIASMNNDWAAYFAGISQGAADAFKSVQETASRSADGTSLALGRYLGALSDGAVALKQRIEEQKVAVDQLLGSFSDFGNGAGTSVQQTTAELSYMLRALENNRSALDLLDKASVDKLDGAIKGVETRLQSVRDAAAAARGELASTAADLQDQLDQQDGKAKDIEDRRYARQRQQILDLGAEKGLQGTKEYNDALANAEELHKRKLENIASESAAAATAQASTAAASRASAATTSSTADAAEREAAARERSATAANALASAAASTPATASVATTVQRNEFVIIDKTGERKFTDGEVDQLMPKIIEAIKKALRDSGAV